jgi:hypothetical protein
MLPWLQLHVTSDISLWLLAATGTGIMISSSSDRLAHWHIFKFQDQGPPGHSGSGFYLVEAARDIWLWLLAQRHASD